MQIALYSTSCVSSILAALGLTPLIIRGSKRWGVVDLPNSRKVHQHPTPRLGGLAIAGAVYAVAVPLLFFSGAFGVASDVRRTQLIVILSAAALVLIVGVFDDVLNLSSRFKLVALATAATAVCGAGVRIDDLLIHGKDPISLGWGTWPVTLLWIVGITVSINFIDGLDGLAAGICAVACAVIALTAGYSGQSGLTILAISLMGSLIGFLFYNSHPAKVFMGDCGSLFIGFLVACLALFGAPKLGTTTGLMLPALALSIPLLDTFLTFIRRTIIFRRSIFSAERGHIHHRLLDLGLGQRHAVLFLYIGTLLSAGSGMLAILEGGWATVAGLSLLVPVLGGLFHVAGSARVRETISAVRRNRAIGREAKLYQQAFEELQLRLRPVQTFDAWWQEVCSAAQMLDFVRLSLPVSRRDGTSHVLLWHRTDSLLLDCDAMTATVPIRQRRAGGPLRAEAEVAIHTLLESAGHRVALFSRLMGEFNLANLPDSATRITRSRGPAGTESEVSRAPVDGELPGQASQDSRGVKVSREKRAGKRNGRVRRPTVSLTVYAGTSVENRDGGVWAPSPDAQPRVAIVHDFLYCYAGAERVLEQIIRVFPEAELFSLFDFIPPNQRGFLGNKAARTSFIQRLPLARRKHRLYLPLMPLAIEQLDVSKYDIVISSSYLVAKGVITRPDQMHVCYCHTPVRFAWDMQHQYLGETGLGWGMKSMVARLILHYIRAWDVRTSNGVDLFLTNSEFVGRRIEKVYRRQAQTVYPPVDTERFTLNGPKEDFYLTASRMVPYKRIDLIVNAFTRMPHRRLIVVGDGPEFSKIKAMATPNIRLVGHQPFDKLKQYMQLARAFIFAAEEDFGIVPVEAQACGTPVIAYGRGGVIETIINGRTGLFFTEQTPEAMIRAVEEFERGKQWDPAKIRQNAERFSATRFRQDLERLVKEEWLKFLAHRLEIAPRPEGFGVANSEPNPINDVRPGLIMDVVEQLGLPSEKAS